MSVTDVQLAGGSAVTKAQTASRSDILTVAQAARRLTPSLKAAVLSMMQAEYCDTVAVQVAGMAAQLGVAGPASRHVLSWLLQFSCSLASEGALLDTAYVSPVHLHKVGLLMACPK